MVNVRTQIPDTTSANLAYASKITGIPKADCYRLCLEAFVNQFTPDDLSELLAQANKHERLAENALPSPGPGKC